MDNLFLKSNPYLITAGREQSELLARNSSCIIQDYFDMVANQTENRAHAAS